MERKMYENLKIKPQYKYYYYIEFAVISLRAPSQFDKIDLSIFSNKNIENIPQTDIKYSDIVDLIISQYINYNNLNPQSFPSEFNTNNILYNYLIDFSTIYIENENKYIYNLKNITLGITNYNQKKHTYSFGIKWSGHTQNDSSFINSINIDDNITIYEATGQLPFILKTNL